MAFVESVQLVKTLPCLADPGKLIVIAQPSRSIDGVLPLVASVAPNVIAFNPMVGTLTLRRERGFISFYPDKVVISQVLDTAEGLELLDGVRNLVNQCWEHRDTIQPVTTARRTPRPLDVWSLLPQPNCKRCGEATCIAFACALLLHERTVDQCSVIAQDEAFADRRTQLTAMM